MTVSVEWDTRHEGGDQEITVTADKTGLIDEISETNNSATRVITVRGKGRGNKS